MERLLRGPRAVIVDLDECWSKSNYDPGGCKHDVWSEEQPSLAGVGVTFCAKCGCVILSKEMVGQLAREVAEFMLVHDEEPV